MSPTAVKTPGSVVVPAVPVAPPVVLIVPAELVALPVVPVVPAAPASAVFASDPAGKDKLAASGIW
jgi:hypothetical protein